MNNLFLGKYINKESALTKINPVIKIIFLICFLVLIFLRTDYEGYIYLTFVVMFFYGLGKMPFKIFLSQWKLYLFLFLFLFIISAALATQKDPGSASNFAMGKWYFPRNALYKAIYIVWRIFLMISITTILTSTTKTTEIAFGIEKTFFFLKYIRVPIHEMAMMITIALRFIPTFLNEASIIMKAQQSRGIDIKSTKIKEKVYGIMALIIPLFVISFQKAEDLANSMDVRGYVPNKKRTKEKLVSFNMYDFFAIIFMAAIICLIAFTYVGNKHSTHGWMSKLNWIKFSL